MTQALIRIDPRIRARRVAVRRAEGRRRLRFLIVALGVVATCVGAWALTRTPLFDLDHVRVEGVVIGSVVEIDDAVGPLAGSPLIDIDTSAIAERVRALPWVHSVEVRRDWPGTLRIDVVERTPVALILAGEGSYAAIDAVGVVIGIHPATTAPGLAIIDIELAVEPGETQESATAGLAVAESLSVDLLPWIERIVGSDDTPASLTLELVGGAVVELGDTALIGDKLQALRAVLAGAELDCIVTIDVSVADLTTIRRDEGCGGGVKASDG